MEVIRKVDFIAADDLNKTAAVTVNSNKEDMYRPTSNQRPVDDAKERRSGASSLDFTPFGLQHDTKRGEINQKEMLTTISNPSRVEAVYPCTPLQEGIMALSIMQHGKYTPRMMYKLAPGVDMQRFKLAWQATVNSNTILRTVIVQTSSCEMNQAVLKSIEIEWLTASDLDQYLQRDRQVVAGFGKSLFGYAIVSDSASKEDYFIWTVHHAAIDGWSLRLLLDQVDKRYKGGEYTPLDPFQRFITHLSGQNSKKTEGFWSKKLACIKAKHFPSPSTDGSLSQAKSSILHPVVLPKFSRELATISTIIQAAWALLLSQRTSSKDVIYGVVLAGRNSDLECIKTTCGPTFTTVPFRLSIQTEKSGRELMNSVRATKSEMKPYQHAGIQNIQLLSPDCAFACRFQNLLVIQPAQERTSDSLFANRLNESDHWTGLNTYSLLLQCQVMTDGFNAHAIFDADAISTDEMKVVLHDFEFNILHLLANADQPVDSLMSTSLEPTPFKEFFSSGSPRIDSTVHELVERHIEYQPDSVALCSWDGQLSREDLSLYSSTLACKVKALILQGKQTIPLLFEKSMWTVVAMMAIMKAGGTFVALSPADPKERLRDRIIQLDSTLVLCSERCFQDFQGISEEMMIVGPSLSKEAQPTELNLEPVSPATIIYVIFTSGSTGKPKGVEVENSACCSSLTQLIKSYEMDNHTRTLQFSSYGFDGCILEIFGTLIAGGCVCIPSEETRLDGLANFITKEDINFAFLVTSFARTIDPVDVSSLEKLIIGGETVRQEDVDQWFGRLRLYIAYGPTECCIMCTALEITKRIYENYVPGLLGPFVVGDAIVIDEIGHIARMEDIGELYVGGPALAKGYLDAPVLTEAAFRCCDPWTLDLVGGPDRWYKTGDLAKMRPDGSIEYIGRKDKQVKIRGQRLELGEVEFHVRKCLASISDVAVHLVAPTDDPKNPLLAAFASLSRNQSREGAVTATLAFNEPLAPEVSAEAWINLVKSLPEYMVPSVFFPINQMPLSTTGKRDMKTLVGSAEKFRKDEMMIYSCAKREVKSPTTRQEVIMQRAWAEVLKLSLDSIGRNDSFIRLGGDSIRAMKLAAVCRREGLALTVADIFRHPKLYELALVVLDSQSEAEESRKALPPFALMLGRRELRLIIPAIVSQCKIDSDQIEDVYPCTPLQEGMMVLSCRRPGAYVVRHEIELPSDIVQNLEFFRLAWEKVVQSNPILRTRIIQTEQDGFLQIVVKEQIHWCFKEQMYGAGSGDIADPPMTLGSPLSQYTVTVKTHNGSESHVFGWMMHHSIYDARSIQLLLDQVDDVYRSLALLGPPAEQDINVRVPPLQFNSYIQEIQSCNLIESDRFWHGQISSGEPKMFPNVPINTAPLPESELESDFELPPHDEASVTLSTLVRAAWALTVSLYANSDDIVFGVTLSGRMNSECVNDMVGPTICTVPVRIRCIPETAAEDFLSAVHNQSLEMAPFEQTGLAKLRRMSREAKAACDFQSLLVVQYNKSSVGTDSIFSGLERNAVHIGVFDTYALTMECTIIDNSLRVKAIFDAQIIDPDQMRRIISQFKYTLSRLCTTEGRDLMLKDLQTANHEDLQMIWTWNVKVPEKVDICIHSLIQDQILYSPEAQAICAWDGNFTYHDLDSQSSRLAQHLERLGVRPEVTVPVLFQKSKWYAVAVLGILRAGGAFAPLEPSHPEARLISIVDSLKPPLLVCSPELKDLASSIVSNSKIVSFGDCELDQLPSTSEDRVSSVSPGSAAYVVFTSGTTGTPKGIVIEHSAYATSAKEHAVALGFDQKSRHLQFASHSFDTSIEDILTTFITGGCICVPSERQRDQDIAAAIQSMNVNKADLTPSFLSHIKPSDVPTLETLILGGEPLTSQVIKDWTNHVRLINGYGTSECAVTNLVNGDLKCDTEASNIGRATGGVAWILNINDHNKLAPVGTTGELAIEGPILARGYLNNENLTEIAFINSPAWAREINGVLRPGRVYKTGDLAQYNADGTFSYRGRKDTQVKFHGQRMELQEIEGHLVDHPNVEKAVVLLPGAGPCENTLTAVVEARGAMADTKGCTDLDLIAESHLNETGLDWSELSVHLSTKVPGYMVPKKWAAVRALPLHITKKLDRARVTSWIQSLSGKVIEDLGGFGKKPQLLGADETIALQISDKIADLVGDASIKNSNPLLSSIGVDSIRISSLIAFIRESYGISIPMQKLMSIRTSIRDVAKYVLDAKTNLEGQNLPSLHIMKEVEDLSSSLLDKVRHRKFPLRNVFLTGATGFLGTQILRILLESNDVANVIAHVRARDVVHGRERVIASAREARWWSEDLAPKLEIWYGDLAKPQLGLDTQQWRALSSVDAIIHNGAAVQWIADYHSLKAANVTSTKDLLSAVLASERPCCPPHFVYVSGGRDFGDEVSDIEAARLLSSVDGYSQTKFVSELLVKRFMKTPRSEARRVHITKPGLIIGTAHEGVASKEDFLWRYVAAVIDVGGFPTPHSEVDWLPVSSADKVALTTVQCILRDFEHGQRWEDVHHIDDGIPLSDLWKILRDLKYELKSMTYNEWIVLLKQRVEVKKEKHPFWPVMHLIQDGNLADRRPKRMTSNETALEIKAAIRKNVEYLIEIGFLKAPK